MTDLVYTGGTFDLFHSGHVKFLESCAKLGSVHVSLNTDDFVESYKGSKPVVGYKDRLEVLLSCKYVTSVGENIGGFDSKPAIELVNPSIIAVGSDWMSKDYHKQMGFTQEWLDNKNIQLIYIPYTEGISSTLIKNKLLLAQGGE